MWYDLGMSESTTQAKTTKKSSSVRHTRAIQRDRSKRPASAPPDESPSRDADPPAASISAAMSSTSRAGAYGYVSPLSPRPRRCRIGRGCGYAEDTERDPLRNCPCRFAENVHNRWAEADAAEGKGSGDRVRPVGCWKMDGKPDCR